MPYEEGRNVTTQAGCEPRTSGSDLLAELVRTLDRDAECAISTGSKPSGVVGAGTLQW